MKRLHIVKARLGQDEVVRILLAAGADRAQEDLEGKTALDWARAEGHVKVVSALS